jgi:hypothetical protein
MNAPGDNLVFQVEHNSEEAKNAWHHSFAFLRHNLNPQGFNYPDKTNNENQVLAWRAEIYDINSVMSSPEISIHDKTQLMSMMNYRLTKINKLSQVEYLESSFRVEYQMLLFKLERE